MMKKAIPLCAALLLNAAPPAFAGQAASLEAGVAHLQAEWAQIKYQMSDESRQVEALRALEAEAEALSVQFPDRAEPKIWEGIILSTDAGIDGGFSALGKVKKARALFETALQQNPAALDGSAHTSLGTLYYQVPIWPIAFGDDEEAEKHLTQALSLNPDGIDPNYFYGDFLMQDGRFDEAQVYLERALAAPARPARALADEGRRQEIRAALVQLAEKRKNTGQQKQLASDRK